MEYAKGRRPGGETMKRPCVNKDVAVAVLAVCAMASPSHAAENDLSLEDILNLKVSVASKKAMTTREAPGIVTLITSEEIRHSGARDLIDVLHLVPGISFGADVLGVTGLTMRGQWGHEGKILLLWDGQEMNELFYNNTVFGNHYPVDQIKRIEVMRGPGSAVYGGYAELAVINIVSKEAGDLNGVQASVAYGQMTGTYAQRNLNLAYGKKYSDDLSVSLQTFVGQGVRSGRDYTDMNGASANFASISSLDPFFANLGVQYRDLEVKALFDRYRTIDITGYGTNLPYPESVSFTSFHFGAKYKFQLAENLKLIPSFNFKQTEPWRVTDDSLDLSTYSGVFFDKVAQRFTESLTFDYDMSSSINLLAGVEFYQDDATSRNPAMNPVVTDPAGGVGLTNVRYNNAAAFAQGIVSTEIANFTVGARFEDHSVTGTSFVPRFAATKQMGATHVKLLASKAFRAPSIENIKLNASVAPEKTTVYEIEAGHQLTERTFVVANVFDSRINQPIVYFYDTVAVTENYLNYEKTGSRGVELQYQLKDRWGYFNTAYSFYQVNENLVDAYAVADQPKLLKAAPAHKLTFNGSVELMKDLRFNPSVIYLSERWGNDNDPANPGTSALRKFDPALLANVYFSYNNVMTRGLDLGAGVFNLLNTDYRFVNPNGGMPLPGPSRDFVFKLSYSMNI